MSAKPGRNDPCLCGSGKKFKRCCLPLEEAAARERAQPQALYAEPDDNLDVDADDLHFEIVDEDCPPIDVRTIRRVRYTRGIIDTLPDLRRGRGLHVTEWAAPNIPQTVLDSIEREDLAALEGEWGDSTLGDPIQVDVIDLKTPEDIFSIEIFNRGICLLGADSDEIKRIHRACETLRAAAQDDSDQPREAGGRPATVIDVPSGEAPQDTGAAIDLSAIVKQHRQQPGTCDLCGAIITRRKSRTHFTTCAPAHDNRTSPERELVHLQAAAPGLPAYWLDIEVRTDARLQALDAFLRDIWLECCGHLSMFKIGDVEYYSGGYEFETGPFRSLGRHRPAQRRMTARLIDTLPVHGERFGYEYDFGSTTCVEIKVIGTRTGRLGRIPLRLLARNTPPVWPCAMCGEPATLICSFCYAGEGNAFVCRKHGRRHSCGERDGFMPVVNSPRMGVCGYTGE